MLRDRDYLLTLAAVWLLVASLNSKSRPNFVITASAASQRQQDGHSYFEQSPTPMQVDLLMSKIKQNLEQPKKQIQPVETRRVEAQPRASQPTNFSSYEDHNDNSDQNKQIQNRHQKSTGSDSKAAQFREAKEVRVDRLRSNRKSQVSSNATSSVYLLNQNSFPAQQLASNHIDGDVLAGSEQQPQPFLIQPNPNSLAQQQDIRQILQNYQRNPQLARQLTDQQRQMLTQLQPRPPQLHLRPPTSPAPAFGLANGLGGPQPPQQMLSPLQLLAGPLQAFLPALTAGQQQQSNQLSGADRRPASGTTPAPNSAIAPQQPPPLQQPLGGLLNAFNLAPNRPGQQIGSAAPGGLANLQDFYQQLPLYQALLAARQRQEALQTAERVRQQQQGGGGGAPFNIMPPLPPPQSPTPNTIGSGGNALPLPPAPPFATGPLPPSNAFDRLQPQAQPPSNGNQNLWPPPSSPTNAAGHQQVQRPPATTSNQQGPVQFDDDEGQRANNNENGSQQEQNKNDKHDNGNQQQADNNAENNNNSNDNGNNDDAGNHQDQGDSGQQQPQHNNQADQNEADKVQEELEDKDFKQFQNLANGAGDPLSDFGIPKGFMSDNDVNEIKSQQAEQARKQEAEERQRQQQQQQQQQQQPPPQQQQQQQPLPNNQNEPDDNNNSPIDNSNQNNETGQPQDNQDEQDDENEGGEQTQGEPTAAALTAKSSSASETTKRDAKLAESPGVEYAK